MYAAIEDVRPSIGDDQLAALFRVANDEVDVELSTLSYCPASNILLGDNAYPGDAPQQLQVVPLEADHTADDAVPATRSPVAGDRLEIHWLMVKAYYPGVISKTASGNRHVISYRHGDTKTIDLEKEAWRFF